MNNKPLVSIITPCYNQGEYLAETLLSILHQSYNNWECIIFNDGSSDCTEEVALEYCSKDNRFKYFFQENSGIVSARNNAIKKSKGKYILPLDSDDKISSTYIEKAVKILEDNSRIKIVYGNAEYFGAKQGNMALRKYDFFTLLVENCIFCSAMFRRNDYNLTKGYNENMKQGWEDWDFWISLLEQGGDVYKLNETVLYYRIKDNSRNVNANKNIFTLHENIFKNHENTYHREYFKLWQQYKDITNSKWFVFFKVCRYISNNIKKIGTRIFSKRNHS